MAVKRLDYLRFATNMEGIRPPWPALYGVPLLAMVQSTCRAGFARPWQLPFYSASTVSRFP